MSAVSKVYDLLGFEGLGLPCLMQDETLYSWCARYSLLAMHFNAKVTSRLLFGSASAGLHHEIPSHLNEFERRTQGYLGSAEWLLYSSTFFGFYSKFLTEDLRLMCSQYFISTYSTTARFKLGLNHGSSAVDKILKYCPKCMENQYQAEAFAWWKLSHQLPTSFVCLEHDDALRFLILPYRRGYATDFYTPSIMLDAFTTHDSFDNPQTHLNMRKVSYWGAAIQQSHGLQLSDQILRWCFIYQMSSRGWIAANGQVMPNEIRDRLVSHYGEFLDLLGEDFKNNFTDLYSSFYRQLVQKVPGRQHPLNLVLLINFLFESFEEFLVTFKDVTSDLSQGGVALCRAIVGKKNLKIAQLKIKAGESIEQAISLLEVSGMPVAKALRKNRGIHQSLPRIVGTEKEIVIQEKLLQGCECKEISVSLGVRTSYIKKYLAKRPILRQKWKDANHLRQVATHREQFLAALKENPGASLNSIKRISNNGFSWLYNNDRDWLDDALPSIWRNSF